MPRKARSTSDIRLPAEKSANYNEMEWGGFINVRLTDDDKTSFGKWSIEHELTFWSDFQDYVSRGFKFGLSYNAEEDFYLATFTAGGKALIGIDARCCLTARAPAWEDAVMLLLFKHEVLAHGNWGTYRVKEMRFDNFG